MAAVPWTINIQLAINLAFGYSNSLQLHFWTSRSWAIREPSFLVRHFAIMRRRAKETGASQTAIRESPSNRVTAGPKLPGRGLEGVALGHLLLHTGDPSAWFWGPETPTRFSSPRYALLVVSSCRFWKAFTYYAYSLREKCGGSSSSQLQGFCQRSNPKGLSFRKLSYLFWGGLLPTSFVLCLGLV